MLITLNRLFDKYIGSILNWFIRDCEELLKSQKLSKIDLGNKKYYFQKDNHF